MPSPPLPASDEFIAHNVIYPGSFVLHGIELTKSERRSPRPATNPRLAFEHDYSSGPAVLKESGVPSYTRRLVRGNTPLWSCGLRADAIKRANPASWKHANLYGAYSFLDIGAGVDLQELVNLLEAARGRGDAAPD